MHHRLTGLLAAGIAVDDDRVQLLIDEHYRVTSLFWTPSRQAYLGLAQTYQDDDRFSRNIGGVITEVTRASIPGDDHRARVRAAGTFGLPAPVAPPRLGRVRFASPVSAAQLQAARAAARVLAAVGPLPLDTLLAAVTRSRRFHGHDRGGRDGTVGFHTGRFNRVVLRDRAQPGIHRPSCIEPDPPGGTPIGPCRECRCAAGRMPSR